MGSKESLRFEPTPVFSAILEGGQTFMDLSRKYGLDVKEFERLLREKVEEKDFDRLQKASKQNWKKRKKLGKHKKRGLPKTQKAPTHAQLIELQAHASSRIEELSAAMQDEEGRLASANAKVAEAEEALRMARKEQSAARRSFNVKKGKLDKWTQTKAFIDAQLQEIDNRVYLVAPGYHGKLPNAGKFVSVVPFEGAELEEAERLNEPTAKDFESSGYTLVQDVLNAYKFAGLVVKYELEDVEAQILVDDERIVRILKEHGLEV